jgi:hypothetical protein
LYNDLLTLTIMAAKKPPVAKGKAVPPKGKPVPPKGRGGVSDAQASARD